jgi:hypothetical protein
MAERRLLILSDDTYKIEMEARESDRAFDRYLIDFTLDYTSVSNPKRPKRALVGGTRELFEDYPSFKIDVPLDLLILKLFRNHFIANTLDVLSQKGGPVLTTENFREYLGEVADLARAETIARDLLANAFRAEPEVVIQLEDLFVSSDLTFEVARRTLRFLESMGELQKVGDGQYKIQRDLVKAAGAGRQVPALDKKNSRYFQAVAIQARDPFCFVLMPFKQAEFDQRVYTDGIKPCIEKRFGIDCYRVDEDFLPDRIDNKIYTYLLRSGFVVAEISTRNPNVMYELGLAHMLEKDVIVLTQGPGDIPFDVSHLRVCRYGSPEELEEQLIGSIRSLGFRPK